MGTLLGPALPAAPCHPTACTASTGKPQPRHWDLDHKATQKAISKGSQNPQHHLCCYLAGAKSRQYHPFLLHASEVRGRTSHSPCIASSFTLPARPHTACARLRWRAHSSPGHTPWQRGASAAASTDPV